MDREGLIEVRVSWSGRRDCRTKNNKRIVKRNPMSTTYLYVPPFIQYAYLTSTHCCFMSRTEPKHILVVISKSIYRG